jgi:hypothetical protein
MDDKGTPVTAEALGGLLQGLTEALNNINKGQEKIVAGLKSLEENTKSGAFKIDPAKLVATTQGLASKLTVVQPKDPTKPNLEEPVLNHPYTGAPMVKICWKCNQPFSGMAVHCPGGG